MIRQNMGRLDRILRFAVGVALLPIGLFALSGLEGNLIGVVVAALAALPLVTSTTGFCPLYVPFGASTIGREGAPARTSTARG